VSEKEDAAKVEREESAADRGSDELPDPDREGPDPDSENPAEDGDED